MIRNRVETEMSRAGRMGGNLKPVSLLCALAEYSILTRECFFMEERAVNFQKTVQLKKYISSEIFSLSIKKNQLLFRIQVYSIYVQAWW